MKAFASLLAVPLLAFAVLTGTLGAELDHLELDPKLSPHEATHAQIYLGPGSDLDTSIARLTIELKRKCPPGQVCILSIPEPLVIELPIHSSLIDKCGIRTVSASAPPQEMTLIDSSTNHCPSATPPPPNTQVIYKTEDSQSTFSGEDRLKPT